MVSDPSSRRVGLIEVEGVGFAYGEPSSERRVEALKDVSFQVGEKQFVSIIGPSGCGKSTLLKLVSGLLPPTSGVIRSRGPAVLGGKLGRYGRSPGEFPGGRLQR